MLLFRERRWDQRCRAEIQFQMSTQQNCDVCGSTRTRRFIVSFEESFAQTQQRRFPARNIQNVQMKLS